MYQRDNEGVNRSDCATRDAPVISGH